MNSSDPNWSQNQTSFPTDREQSRKNLAEKDKREDPKRTSRNQHFPENQRTCHSKWSMKFISKSTYKHSPRDQKEKSKNKTYKKRESDLLLFLSFLMIGYVMMCLFLELRKFRCFERREGFYLKGWWEGDCFAYQLPTKAAEIFKLGMIWYALFVVCCLLDSWNENYRVTGIIWPNYTREDVEGSCLWGPWHTQEEGLAVSWFCKEPPGGHLWEDKYDPTLVLTIVPIWYRCGSFETLT